MRASDPVERDRHPQIPQLPAASGNLRGAWGSLLVFLAIARNFFPPLPHLPAELPWPVCQRKFVASAAATGRLICTKDCWNWKNRRTRNGRRNPAKRILSAAGRADGWELATDNAKRGAGRRPLCIGFSVGADTHAPVLTPYRADATGNAGPNNATNNNTVSPQSATAGGGPIIWMNSAGNSRGPIPNWRFAFRFTPPRFSVFWVFSLGQSGQFVHNLQHRLKASDVLVRFHLSVMAFVAVSGIGAAQTSDLTMQGRYALAGLLLVHRQTLRLTGICVEVAGWRGAGFESDYWQGHFSAARSVSRSMR
jgi:hypothetical protein